MSMGRGRRPRRSNFTVFDRPEQLHLHGRSNIADLVQKHCPALRQLEQPLAVLDRACERAPEVAEELAFDQARAEGREADGQEGPSRRVL